MDTKPAPDLESELRTARFTIAERDKEITKLKRALDIRDQDISMLKDMLREIKPAAEAVAKRIARWV
jgi:hypothetical protein